MPELKRAPNAEELEKLIALFLKAETDIINEIGRLRSMGNVDYSSRPGAGTADPAEPGK